MDIGAKSVASDEMVLGIGLGRVTREYAKMRNAIPDVERIERAKARFESVGLYGAKLLIEAIQMQETRGTVISYFGFTFDREGLSIKPLEDGETDLERGMKLMGLPHPQWGSPLGKTTVIAELVAMSELVELGDVAADKIAILSEAWTAGASFLTRELSAGKA